MKIYIRIWYTLVFLLSYGYVAVGKAFNPQGAIQEAEFVIKKERKNALPEFPKLFKNAPLMPEDTKPIFQYVWDWEHPLIPFQPIEHKVKLLRMQPDKLEEVYSNCLRMGYGNYYTPYLMAFLTQQIQHAYVYDILISHISAGTNQHFETFHNQAEVGGKLFTNSFILTHAIHYHWDKYPFFALKPGKPLQTVAPTQSLVYQNGGIVTELYNRIAGPFNYNLQVEGGYLHQEKIKEPQGAMRLHVNRRLTAGLRANVDTTCHLIQYTHPGNALSKLRNVLTLTPTLDTAIQKLAITTGVKLAYQNDTHALAKRLDWYPAIRISYALHNAFQPYVTVDGDMEPQSWATYIQQNPWIHHTVAIQYVNKPVAGTLGVQGDVLNLQWHVGITCSRYQNYPCFTNHASDPRTFDIQYDSLAIVTHEFVEVSIYNMALRTLLQAKYFQYALTDLQAPWHRPTYQLGLVNTYNFHEKLLITLHLLWEGGRKAKKDHTLPLCMDLALGLEYFWNQRFVIFIDWQNMLAKANQKYLYTPTYGSHIVAGIAYRW